MCVFRTSQPSCECASSPTASHARGMNAKVRTQNEDHTAGRPRRQIKGKAKEQKAKTDPTTRPVPPPLNAHAVVCRTLCAGPDDTVQCPGEHSRYAPWASWTQNVYLRTTEKPRGDELLRGGEKGSVEMFGLFVWSAARCRFRSAAAVAVRGPSAFRL